MMFIPKYSIIIPSYNTADTIGHTLDSIISQTYKEFEIIIIDGGSKDGTLEIVQKYAPFIRYQISEKDKGIYDAMNKGVRKASGNYIIFLGADDVFYNNDVLADVSPYLKEDNVYYGQAYFINKKIMYDSRFHSFKFALRNICHQAIFYPSGILRNYEFDLRYPLLADYHLNLLLVKQNVKFEYIGVTISKFNDAGASAITADEPFEKDKLRLIRENLGYMPYIYARFRRFLFPAQKIILAWLRRTLQNGKRGQDT